ncbi:MAG: lipid-A-disaccharide synthase N-terminal domain-containing protein [Rhodospirillaceae bacterium]|nr:lipid-A-disaccharide synthase N-terminal domain-containing protein [Rhodospirillaceae bacterium]MDE0617844.1 lipid-A-disaccharide synthase N-terminal domain-containing protein [Rhodospirillaceae bacterium]MDE0718530.1 lipid-A-disaccharide synthase N-terminal domain-containing protein [Rhodospirillaceae bacterium]
MEFLETLKGLMNVETSGELIWVMVGFLGQAMFSARFIIQWFVSEKAKESIVPIAFWYFSILGGMTLLTYAIWRRDPVIICGQAGGLMIYARNLWFIYSKRAREADRVPTDSDAERLAADTASEAERKSG